MNKKELMYKRIADHGNKLNEIFGLSEDPITLCKRLHRLEREANRKMVAYCNGDTEHLVRIGRRPFFTYHVTGVTSQDIDTYQEKSLIPRLAKIVGADNMEKIYINRDPRGYTLKLTEAESLRHTGVHKDLGGYVIIAPDFSE